MNLKRLICSALAHVPASPVFKSGLLAHLGQVFLAVLQPDSSDPGLEENLAELLVNSTPQVAPLAGFKERLYYQIMTTRPKKKRLAFYLAPAFSAAVVLVLIFGFFVYPELWSGYRDSITAAVDQGSATVIKTKPVFFNWGVTLAQSGIKAGDTISLKDGETIKTGPGSQLVLSLYNNSTVKIYPNSEVLIIKYDVNKVAGSTVAKLKLIQGKATSSVNSIDYTIDSPVASASVLGTEFRTEVISKDQTNLATDEGTVKVSMEGNTVNVAEGEQVQAIRGQPLVVSPQKRPVLMIGMRNSTVYYRCDTNSCIIKIPEELKSSPVTLVGTTDPEAALLINNKPVDLDISGWFSAVIDLKPGQNDIAVSASNRSGMTTVYVVITLSAPK